MRSSLLVLALACAVGSRSPLPAQEPPAQPPASAQTVEVVEETEIDRQVRQIAAQLRCPVCQGLSLQDSPSELAQEMRDVIRTRLEAGDTPDEVLDYFVGRYDEWILLEPKAEGFNLAVYLLPILAMLGGGVLLVIVGRRWLRARPPSGDTTPAVDEQDPDLAAWDDLVRR